MTYIRVPDHHQLNLLARLGWEAVNAFDESNPMTQGDDFRMRRWDEVPDYERESLTDKVRRVLAGNGPEQLHEYTLDDIKRRGHQDPALYVRFEELSPTAQRRLTLFVDTVSAAAPAFTSFAPPPQAASSPPAAADTRLAYVGAPVTYVNGYGHPMPAVITYIYGPTNSTEPTDVTARALLMANQTVDLHVFYPSYDRPVEYAEGVPFGENRPLSWRWP